MTEPPQFIPYRPRRESSQDRAERGLQMLGNDIWNFVNKKHSESKPKTANTTFGYLSDATAIAVMVAVVAGAVMLLANPTSIFDFNWFNLLTTAVPKLVVCIGIIWVTLWFVASLRQGKNPPNTKYKESKNNGDL